jgi:hypothetical protein
MLSIPEHIEQRKRIGIGLTGVGLWKLSFDSASASDRVQAVP